MSTTTPMAPGAIENARGIMVTLADGLAYLVPPFNFRQLRDHHEMIAKMQKPTMGTDAAGLREALEVMHLALVRNYPALTVDDLFDLVDVRNALDLFAAMAGANDFRELQARNGASP